MEINKTIELLIESSQYKRENLQRLMELTINQAHLIQEEQMDQLAEAIAQKQHLMEEINKLDILFLEKYMELKRKLGISSLEQANVQAYPKLKLLKQNTESIMLLLRQMEEMDKSNTKVMSQELEKVKLDMKKLQLQKQQAKVASSYGNKYAGGAQGVFIDNRGDK